MAAVDHPLQEAQFAASIVLRTPVSTLLYRLIDSPEQACTLTPVLISSLSHHVFQEAL
jgi:hypothetical protein